MSWELIDTPRADFRNAQFLARASELAYYDERTAQAGFRSKLGLDAHLISVDNTQAYVGENEQSLVVAFRGSESPTTLDGLKDWLLTNANEFLVLPEGRIGTDFAAAGVGARFHMGFMEALAAIWDPLYAAVNKAQERHERRLWVTGHSLGGALALLAAWRLQQQFLPVHQIYTFGAPMVGNDVAAMAFEREFPGKIFRCVDEQDLVPKLPAVSLVANPYSHCLSELALRGTQALGATAGSARDTIRSLASRATDGILSATLIDELWSHLTAGIAHHMVANYETQIDKRCQNHG